MRSSIADYEVLEMLGRPDRGPHRYRCRPPARLGWDAPVEVMELAVDPASLPQWSDLVIRMAAAGGSGLRVLLEAGPDPTGPGVYLSCEAAPGGTLAEHAGDPAPVGDTPSALTAVAAAARGAHAMHEVGLAHGGIGPESVHLTQRGPVLSPAGLDSAAGFVIGASSWERLSTVDPDLLRGEGPSRSSDIWALGATLHLALSSRPLYPGIDGDQPVTAVQRVMFTRPEPDPALGREIRDLIGACLATDPTDRPATAAELADRLDELEGRR